ncbi:MAG: hypothetical protein ACI9VI_002914, partial [Candidatus Azotimanducaceae bacterium]
MNGRVGRAWSRCKQGQCQVGRDAKSVKILLVGGWR